jgi:rhodanese-related sulfurtransferase
MDQNIEFARHHLLLVSATAAVAVALVVTEILRLKSGASSLEPNAATQLYNREDAVFIDIRSDADYRKARLPGAVHITAATIEQNLDKLKRYRDKPVIVYCANGIQTGRVAAQLKKHGIERVYQLRGGFAGWQSGGFPTVTK